MDHTDFNFPTTRPQVHKVRAREIRRDHPEVQGLHGNNPWSLAALLGAVGAQFGLAWLLRDQNVLLIVAVSWCAGAFFSHALWVLIHELTHNLVTRRGWSNQAWGLVANLPLVVPAAAGFRIHHLAHHRHLGEFGHDADLADEWEINWVRNSPWRKAVWLTIFPVVQAIRPLRFEEESITRSPWVRANAVTQILVIASTLLLLGPGGLAYLFFSTLFSIGFHPLGARWIQEHYVFRPDQETYSYYGPLNLPALNIGYHNEHHDFPRVPWNRLPELRRLGREHYDRLYAHRSWFALWLRFLFDRNLTLQSRITRPDARSAAG